MAAIFRQAAVAYSCEQMFALVSDVNAYDGFLPWCAESVVDAADGERVRATLHLKHKGLGVSFTTLNRNAPPHLIEMALAEGPFSRLDGKWSFTPLTGAGCKVELALNFDFSNRFYAGLFAPVFNRAASSLVDAFVERAHKVYDPPPL